VTLSGFGRSPGQDSAAAVQDLLSAIAAVVGVCVAMESCSAPVANWLDALGQEPLMPNYLGFSLQAQQLLADGVIMLSLAHQ
jgi:hypothetical protein